MKDELAKSAIAQGDDPAIHAVLVRLCDATGMGFAAVACVTDARWIACQVEDRIDFDLNPGDELAIKTTICDDVRECGRAIIIDHVAENPAWRTHPTPILYGFQSYASLPLTLDDGSFFGTLCAIDPKPRTLSAPETIALLEGCAREVAAILSARSMPPAGS